MRQMIALRFWVDRQPDPLLCPNGAECAAVLALVKGKPPLTRRWPPATLDHRCARRADRCAGWDGGMVGDRTEGCTLGRYPHPIGRKPKKLVKHVIWL
jgi:hypothetical protein